MTLPAESKVVELPWSDELDAALERIASHHEIDVLADGTLHSTWTGTRRDGTTWGVRLVQTEEAEEPCCPNCDMRLARFAGPGRERGWTCVRCDGQAVTP